KVNQKYDRMTHDLPSAYPHVQARGLGSLSPLLKQTRIFDEFRIVMSASPHIRSYADILVIELFHALLGLGSHHGVYPTHLITYFPADFKQVIRTFHMFHPLNL